MTTTITARCLCRTNTFSCEIPSSRLPLDANFCHCTSCRHGTGSLAFTACPWPAALPANVEETCTRFAFSPTADVYSCATCGAWLFWHSDTIPWTGVAVGVLDDPAAWCRFTSHMFVPDTKDGGMSVFVERFRGEGLKRFVGHPGEGDMGEDEARVSLSTTHRAGYLEAYCKCKGVRFQVTRPEADEVKFPARICVCHTCRLASGMECMSWSSVPAVYIRISNNGEPLPDPPVFGTIKRYRSSEQADRFFCGSCGATVFRRSRDRPAVLDVAVGMYDAPSGARAEEWLEWWIDGLSHGADGVERGLLAEDLTGGMKAWGRGRTS